RPVDCCALPRLRAAGPRRISRIVETRMAWAAEDLIRRMAEGDADACGRFYDRYARLVYPLIVRIVGDPADAADVLQDVFWEAWQAAGSYDPARGSPEAWIVVRARTRAIDRVRAVRRRGETFVAPLDEGTAAERDDPAGRAADRVTVADMLERLPEHEREVIELAY